MTRCAAPDALDLARRLQCVICKRKDVALFRINARGQPGLWACRKHLPQTMGQSAIHFVSSPRAEGPAEGHTMTAEAPALLPCPFCNARDTAEKKLLAFWFSPEPESMCVICTVCDAEGPSIELKNDDTDAWKSEAIAAWNRRPAPTPTDEQVERVARAIARSYFCNSFYRAADGTIWTGLWKMWRG